MPDITVSSAIDTFMQSASQGAARTALGLGTLATQNGTITDYLTIASAASTYLTQATASSTYAPIASPTFTGTVTIPSGASIAGYLTTAAAAAAYQPLDADLTAIAALTTTTYGRSLLTQADAAAARTTLGLGTAATQASTAFLQLAGGTQSVTGITNFTNNTASTNSTTGAVVVTGGVGVGGAVMVAGNITSTGGNLFAQAGGSIGFSGRVRSSSAADGQIAFTNVSATSLLFQFLGTTNSFPALSTVTGNGLAIQSAAGTATFNDASTAASGTIINRNVFFLAAPTFTATNASTTVSNPATFRIGGAPTASGVTFTNTARALWVENGLADFGGSVNVGSIGNPDGRLVFGNSRISSTGPTLYISEDKVSALNILDGSIRVETGGNIGISTSPSYRLDVNGSFQTNGEVRFVGLTPVGISVEIPSEYVIIETASGPKKFLIGA